MEGMHGALGGTYLPTSNPMHPRDPWTSAQSPLRGYRALALRALSPLTAPWGLTAPAGRRGGQCILGVMGSRVPAYLGPLSPSLPLGPLRHAGLGPPGQRVGCPLPIAPLGPNDPNEPTWRCHQNPFIGALGIQEPVIPGEPLIKG